MSDFFKDIVKELKDEAMSVASDGTASAEFTGYIDTGCYILNALISGSIYGGMADNKVLTIAGQSSTGKTYVALGIVKSFLESDPSAGVIYYDSESAVTKQMMIDRGIDPNRVIIGEPVTIQDFRKKALDFLAAYASRSEKERPPVLMVLDSLGALSSSKEVEDTQKGEDTRDMTKAQLIRGLFRVLRLKLAKLHIPMIVNGHTYAGIGMYAPPDVLSGGGGLKYSSDCILFLRKKKDKEGTEVVGNILTGMMYKSRLSRENQNAEMRLSYDTGLDRYYGLLDLGLKHGLVERVGNRYKFLGDETRMYFKKHIEADPQAVFTGDVLDALDEAARREFTYGVRETDFPPHDPETGEVYEDVE